MTRTYPPSVQCLGEHRTIGCQLHENLDGHRRRSLQEIREAIPPELFVRDTKRGLTFLARDLLLAAVTLAVGISIDSTFVPATGRSQEHVIIMGIARWAAWCA